MSDAFAQINRLPVYMTRLAIFGVAAASLVWLLQTGTVIFLPLLFALVVGVVFAPLSDIFDRLGAPRVVGALAVLLIVLAALVLGFFAFYPVVAEFILRIPFMWMEVQRELGDVLSGLRSTMENVESVQDRVADTLDPGSSRERESAPAVAVPGLQGLVAYLPSIAAQIMTFVGVLYFFLLTRTEIYAWIEQRSSSLTEKSLCRAELEVSRYFLAITAINATFGVLFALVLSALGMPNFVYWGLGAFVVNYVLYLGPIAFAMVLAFAGMIVFDGAMSFVPAAAYLSMNMTEGQFVTPSLVGRHMSVNPLLVFLSLVFWMWLWGPLGGVIAIPLLVWLRQVNKAMQRHRQPAASTPAGTHDLFTAMPASAAMERPHGTS